MEKVRGYLEEMIGFTCPKCGRWDSEDESAFVDSDDVEEGTVLVWTCNCGEQFLVVYEC